VQVVQVRRRSLYRACAIVLLLWTAVDLTNMRLCALDNEDVVSMPADGSDVPAAGDAPVPDTPAPHVDDCFCCSRCVEPSPVTMPPRASIAPHRPRSLTDALPVSDHVPVYHPPQALG
jgi:hypothetical protein